MPAKLHGSQGVVTIAGRRIGAGHPAFIVAEVSANHNGELSRAIATIEAAAEAGADAVKFQTYRPESLTIDSDRPEFMVSSDGPWRGRTLFELYSEGQTPYDWHAAMFAAARKAGIPCFSTPFDDAAVDLLEQLNAPAYKVASFELVDDGLLQRVARPGRPVVLSTGMATFEEIEHALTMLRRAGAREILLLRCTSSYPAPDIEMQLASIPALAEATGCPVGLSDHSMGTTAPVVAVTLGACFIEKHFTLNRSDGGLDSHFSLEPAEFRQLVADVRRTEAMIGKPSFGPSDAERASVAFRRSLYVVDDIRRGDALTTLNVRSIRPGHGLAPRHLPEILGRKATRDVKRGTPVTWELIERSANPSR